MAMPGSSGMRSRRAKGSWMPRLAGIGVVAVCAAGGLTFYFGSHNQPKDTGHHGRTPAPLSSKIIQAQPVGIIDFGPADHGNGLGNSPNDHPLMLMPTRAGL